MRQRAQHFGRFLLHVFRRFNDDRCLQLASSLTYTSLLSLVPLLTVALTLMSAFPAFGQFTGKIDEFVSQHVLPEPIAVVITRYIQEFTDKAAKLTALGLAGLALTSFMLMYTIERAFNLIWRVRYGRPIAQRILMYWGILTLGPALIGISLTATTYLLSFSLGWTRGVPGLGNLTLGLIAPMFTVAAFTLLYYIVPTRPILSRHALIGGLVAGTLFELMKRGFVLYVALTPSYIMVYGAFAAIPVFLLWIYASWVVTALGAEVTALLPDYRFLRYEKRRFAGQPFADALEILRILVRSQSCAETPDVRVISQRARVPRAMVENILDRLAEAGWAARVGAWRWTLVCDSGRVRIADVYRSFVLDVDPLLARSSADGPRAILEAVGEGLKAALNDPIAVLRTQDAGSFSAETTTPAERSAGPDKIS